MVPHRLHHLALLCLVCVMLLGTVMPAGAAPPPRPLCDACGDSFESTVDSRGVSVTVTQSNATVAVHNNGSATWVVHNRLSDTAGAARLEANESLRTAIADRAMWDTELLSANVSDGVITLRYREADFAQQSVGGTVRTGEFTEAYGYRNLDGLGADQLVVVAPDGMRVGRTIDGATISDDRQRMTLTELTDGRVVTFVPRDTAFGPLLSLLAVGLLLGPVMAVKALAYITLPTAVFTLLIGAAAGGVGWLNWNLKRVRDSAGIVFAGFGALATALSLLGATGVLRLGGIAAPLFGGGSALFVCGIELSQRRVRERASYRTVAGGAVVGAGLALGATIAAAPMVVSDGVTLPVSTLLVLGPGFVLLPAGYAVGHGNRWLAMKTAAIGFVLSMLPVLPVLPAPFGLGVLFIPVTAAIAAAVAIAGLPIFLAGVSLGTPSSG
ncbi:hypothetical protein Har1130_15740 [Haloarcula sp. CBA1130]|uniref:hypothetical protein n=1 Tax=unclassified Haloarcula TaxID=2624677 RepID=UPI001247EBB9|nr:MULTISPECIES: hypothetical protein [unclassified Haloarcula]KAA9395846.1 hypothetical protein Har1129_18175 [Haloarcula sp. CBA1129]KAA9400224.1 hypothetical protein Har1130_15740 [Haloarcula sp. CBA1130]